MNSRSMLWYLAGPMGNVPESEARAWRIRAKLCLDCIDPFDVEADYWEQVCGPGGNLKDRFDDLRHKEQLYQLRREMQPILKLDDQSVAHADGLLVYSPHPSWGTIREVTLAHQQGKPIVIWTTQRGRDLNNTMIALSTVVVFSLDDAIEKCREFERYGS